MAEENRAYPTAKVLVFAIIAAAWVALDQYAKSFFAGMQPAGVLAGPFAGIFDVRLVHNTGGAWGVFSDSTFALGVFSVAVCIALTVFFVASARTSNWLQTISFALIVAGGFGNAIDRFTQGFVTDFIEFSFIDFPVFNIADIGVTCGFALFVIGLFTSMKSSS